MGISFTNERKRYSIIKIGVIRMNFYKGSNIFLLRYGKTGDKYHEV